MNEPNNLTRRDFVRGMTAAAVGVGLLVEELDARAEGTDQAAKPGAPVSCAVIGLGPQGREILTVLSKIPTCPVVAICDTYSAAGFVKRAQDIAPKSTFATDYKQVLSNPAVKAVFVATPSHLHKQIALDAIAAGKHVYCEAPLATSLDDARAIAQAGAAAKTVFQPGLQNRSNKMHNHVLNFVRSQAMGKVAEGRAAWRKRTSWRMAAPTPEREKELNWRLFKATSLGLPGEVGVHAFDVANWYFKAQPVSVTAYGGIYGWNDSRDVPDTVQCVLEYPGDIRFVYDATLVSSFDGASEVFMGSASSILIRDQRGWMFKESDAPMLGWEVYATKDKMGVGPDTFGTGVALVADATKILAAGQEPSKLGADITKSALYYSVSNFLNNAGGGDKQPAATAQDGYAANVVAAKVTESLATGTKITFQKDWFTL